MVAGYAVASDDAPASTTTTTTTTTLAAAADDGSPSGLPEGYVAAGDRLGMRVERILMRDDGVFVTITTVAENSLDPTATTGFQGGLWTLVLSDGRRITSTVESFDALARGTVSVWFPPEGILVDDIEALELNGNASRLTNTFTSMTTEGFMVGEDTATEVALAPTRFDIDAGVTLAVDRLALSSVDGRMEWHLDGEAVAGASVIPILTLGGEEGAIQVPTHVQSSGFALFHPSIAGPTLRADGVEGFLMAESTPLPTDVELGATLELQITWATYEPVVVSLPVDQAAVAVVE